MNALTMNDHVLPRPVERLPEYAHAKARQSLADKLIEAFKLSDASARAIANAVIDPADVRKIIGEPSDPGVEKIPVPGGTLYGIRTTVWSRRVMPDPRNPRTLPSRRHPFAVEPGTGAEDSMFRPVPEPKPLNPEIPRRAELAVDIESRHHLNWACQQAQNFVLAVNNWKDSIKSQGVMEAVWLVSTTYRHSDGSASATTLTTAEGSSRCTAVHSLLDIHSSDVPYDDAEAKFRSHIKTMNAMFDLGISDDLNLRCERMPALIIVDFRPHQPGTTEFPTAIKSLVALRHVDPPKPWGEGPENEALADEVLDELLRRHLISATEHGYYAGSCTRAEAKAAHLPDDPVLRTARIVHLFASSDEAVIEAIRVAVTSQSTRKRITPKLMDALATSLILRAVAKNPADVDQIRRYLKEAFGKSVHRASWVSTGRHTEQLVKDALNEVRAAINDGTNDEPGPSTVELAVRASYPLIVSQRLFGDRGFGNEQGDRRKPGKVLDDMRRSLHGIHQLGQAVRDFDDGRPIRAVDEDGQIKKQADNSRDLVLNDTYIRNEFPEYGKAKAVRPGDTPTDRYDNSVGAFSQAIQNLKQTFHSLSGVLGEDGQPIVEMRGVGQNITDPWRELLGEIDEELVVWARIFRKKYGGGQLVTAEGVSNKEGDDDFASNEDENLFDDIEDNAALANPIS